MELSEIIIDPEFQKLIPPLSPEEREKLETSLIIDGCINPLVVWHGQGILLDGHNRYELCLKHDIECELHEIILGSRDNAKAWIIKNQLGRRNLNESQRAMLATKLTTLFAKDAKERQKHHGGTAPGKPKFETLPSNLKEVSAGEARQQAAAVMNVSSGLVHSAEKVIAKGSDKLQQAIMSGQVSVSAAAEVAKLPKKKQDAIIAAGPGAVARAASEVRKSRVKKIIDQPASRGEEKLTTKQIAALADHVRQLKRLTDVPSMEYSPFHIRKVVAEIVTIVL